MGGRGASSGISAKGKVYGTEYKTLYQKGNIKFIRYNNSTSTTAPMETMTKNRVYATINAQNEVKFITYFDKENKRNKQIDLDKPHDNLSPHTHHGYEHNENDSPKGVAKLTPEEKKMVDLVKDIWYNHLHNK